MVLKSEKIHRNGHLDKTDMRDEFAFAFYSDSSCFGYYEKIVRDVEMLSF